MAARRRRHRTLDMALWATAVLATACGSRPAATIAGSGGSSTSSTSSSVKVEADGLLTLGEADNGGSAAVVAGRRISVTLNSTYWQFAGPSAPEVVSLEGLPAYAPGGSSCPKIPGSGCGTVVATLVTRAPGEVDLAADRTTCGEALRCSEAQAHWRFHVHVTAAATTVAPTLATTTVPRTTDPPRPTTTTTGVPRTTGIQGAVLFAPVCPVERIPPDPQCAPRPGPARIRVLRGDGATAAEVTAGSDGRFLATLPPGTYTVTATPTSPGPGRGCLVEPSSTTVLAGALITVAVTCDTGIR